MPCTRPQECLALFDGQVAGGRVYVVHAGENELQGTAFCPDDEVDTGEVFFKFLLQLPVQQQQKRDQPGAQREEHHVEQRGQRLESQIFPT